MRESGNPGPSDQEIYDSSVVIDGCAPVLMQDLREWKRFYENGVTTILGTVTTADDMPGTMAALSKFHRLIESNPDKLLLVESAEDILEAKRSSRLGIALQFQNARPLGRDIGMVELYRRLGVKTIQLTYNYRNNVGDGCLEPANSGLSKFGREAIRAMNDRDILVDLSHTGERTTLEAMEHSTRPDVFTHANSRVVRDHPRNLTDEQIRAAADKGGVVGLCAFPDFISDNPDPTVADLMPHLEHMVEVAGIDHVSLGTDFFFGSSWEEYVELGNWGRDEYPPPPWNYPLDGSNTLALVTTLRGRGFTPEDVRKILGENLMRVFGKVW
ncbi:dipeptidase [Streptomyces sp. NPDC056773]|uniref:dipeptidase n=1 Tax=unclassified Streptomyces TaxID=2593676 RepID=UPI0036A1721E